MSFDYGFQGAGWGLIGFVLGLATSPMARLIRPRPDPDPEPHPDEDLTAPDDVRRSRDVLVRACIGTADLVRDHNEALWERMTNALTDAGVETVIPDGEQFDPAEFDAVDRLPVKDPDRNRTVASTDLAGYREDGHWIRRPQVVVYRSVAD
ncbi:nucleotide exchange factor GrpE [Streptomyces endophyticus]|uniref:Nucleotide exchange factor GrpE n=1 Tax=Streptomyces endophyticus TaxID=714166 RepID=A0ABU6FCM2_9ACTN|nr:nucleotide exchange factor GrpE [Streptomyces endophyticus]MEB8341729.1 nucleotide exchange factor GrpE [Streptomyces endophyticus]